MSNGSERPTMYFGTLADLAGIAEEHPPEGGRTPAGDTDRCEPPDALEDEDTGLIEVELLEQLREAARREGEP